MQPAQPGCEAMDKSEDAFRTISEAAEELDLPQHVLRFWETRFPQIRPLKRGGGRRYYRPDDVELLRTIRHLLYNEGYTIKGVQRMLKERGVRAVLAMRTQPSEGRPAPAGPAAPSDAEMDSVPLMQASVPMQAPAPARDWGESVDLAAHAPVNAAAPEEAPGDLVHGSARGIPMAQHVLLPRAPAWTGAQRKVIEAIAAELAECRRILGAANI